jgi:hypothetical protein
VLAQAVIAAHDPAVYSLHPVHQHMIADGADVGVVTFAVVYADLTTDTADVNGVPVEVEFTNGFADLEFTTDTAQAWIIRWRGLKAIVEAVL